MVELTNTSSIAFVLSNNLIKTIELTPKIKMTTTAGKYSPAKEKPREIVQKTIVYNREIFQNIIHTL